MLLENRNGFNKRKKLNVLEDGGLGLEGFLVQVPREIDPEMDIAWRKFIAESSEGLVFPCGLAGKESACDMEDLGLIPGLGRSPGEGKGYPLQYSGLENAMDYIVHGEAKSRTRVSDFHFTEGQH